MARLVSLRGHKLGPMKYPSRFPISARLDGGELDGKVIELPAAFRGVDVEHRGKVARYRYGGITPAGHRYQFKESRWSFRPGAARLDFGNEVTGAGLDFYP